MYRSSRPAGVEAARLGGYSTDGDFPSMFTAACAYYGVRDEEETYLKPSPMSYAAEIRHPYRATSTPRTTPSYPWSTPS